MNEPNETTPFFITIELRSGRHSILRGPYHSEEEAAVALGKLQGDPYYADSKLDIGRRPQAPEGEKENGGT